MKLNPLSLLSSTPCDGSSTLRLNLQYPTRQRSSFSSSKNMINVCEMKTGKETHCKHQQELPPVLCAAVATTPLDGGGGS